MNTKRRKTGARLGAMLLSLCLIVGLLPVTALADGTEWDGPTKAFVKAVFSDAVETTGADSQICAATVKDQSGDFVLHYVYSSDSIWNVQLFNRVRDSLAEPYKSLIPVLEKDDHNKKGFLFLSDPQYEDMELDWADPAAVAEALVPGSGTVTTQENTSSVSSGTSTDIIEDYCSDYDEKAVEFINEVGESITRPAGANIIEAIDYVSKGGPFYIIEDGIMKECNDVVILMHVTQISAFTATKTALTKRDTYNVYSDAAIAGGADSQVYAVTIENVDGADLHYVYSPDAIHSKDLMNQIRAGLEEPYKSLIPIFEEDDYFHLGFLLFSRDQAKYEEMSLNWKDPESVAKSLISGSVSVVPNDSAVSVTDISQLHAGEEVVSTKQLSAGDFYTNPPELGQLEIGKNRVETIQGYTTLIEEGTKYFDIFQHMHVTQIYAYTARKHPVTHPVTWDTYFKSYTDASLNGGSDSQVYAATIRDENGDFTLHYVYSPNAIHSNELMDQIRAGLADPYKSLIPKFAQDDLSKQGFLCFSNDPEKYEQMELDWADAEAVAAALVPGEGTVTCAMGDDAVSVTDISEIDHEGAIIIEEGFCDPDLDVSLLAVDGELIGSGGDVYEEIDLQPGKNRVEASIETFEIEFVEIVDNVLTQVILNDYHVMHVTQISACTATKTEPATTPIDLPVRVLEEGDAEYSPAPELSAAFTPDTAVTVGEFNEFQGLAIDYYYPMVDAELSQGYDIQAGYTVSIPLENYQGETLSGTLTIPLPQGYDGATARIKGGASASSYTATTVTFPLTLDVSGNTAEAFELLIEYKEAQEPVQPPVIIAGANGSWQKSGTDGLSFTSNAAFADFIKVQVDGKDLDASNYTVKEGSTIVTLNAAYLNTLSVGKHTLSVVSANGTATTEFTITAAPTGGDDQTGGSDQTGSDTTPQEPDKNGGDTTIPQTGDSSNAVLWIALLFASGVGLMGAAVYSRKKDTANNQ